MPIEPSSAILYDRLLPTAELLHALRDAALLVAFDTRTVLLLNAAATRLLKLAPGTGMESPLAAWTPPGLPSLDDCVVPEGLGPTEVSAVDAHGRPLRLEVSVSPLGPGLGLMILRERPTDELRRAKHAEWLITAGLEGIVIHRQGRLLAANPAFCRMVGIDEVDAVLGQDGIAWVAPESRQEVAARIEMGDESPYEIEMVRQDGTRFPVEVISRQIVEDGDSLRITVLRNLTWHKQAELSLRQSEAEFRNLAENCPYIITRLDREGRHVYMSPAILTMGLTPEFFLGKTHAELGFPPEFGANVRHVLETGEPLSHEYVQPAGDREDIFFTRLVPELGPDGTPTHVLAITQDVTERKRHEEAIAGHVAELARMNEQLREADRYKDEFLSVISHELRTPLNFISGFASILDDEVLGPLTEEQHDATGKILRGADRMLLLVDDLLDFAKVQAGMLELDRGPTDYKHLVAHAADMLRPLVDEKNLTLTHEVASLGAPHIDGHRMTQVLTNLLSNAIKFTEPGGHITVRAYERDGQLVTEVSDTGIGIAEADLVRLFKRFSQLDMGRTRRSGGTGLGLAITKALVQAHGGDVFVTSQAGVGSTFAFTLPLES